VVAVDAVMVHVAVATLVEPLRAVVEAHVVAPPVRVQLTTPLGVAPPLGPVTVAVKTTLWPKVGVEGELVTRSVGVTFATVKLSVFDGPAAV
jgi:hypothetical protein